MRDAPFAESMAGGSCGTKVAKGGNSEGFGSWDADTVGSAVLAPLLVGTVHRRANERRAGRLLASNTGVVVPIRERGSPKAMASAAGTAPPRHGCTPVHMRGQLPLRR